MTRLWSPLAWQPTRRRFARWRRGHGPPVLGRRSQPMRSFRTYGLWESLGMLLGEGLPAVFASHLRWAAALRVAVKAWGLRVQCIDDEAMSHVLTGVVMPQGVDADAVRELTHRRFDMSLGTGLGKLKNRMFRIGHLGDSNDLTLMATLNGCEMGMELAGVKLESSGVQAAARHFASRLAATR